VKEIVVISGKGGTGKTSLTASFAYLGGKDVIVADCDVDAADMHMLLEPDFEKAEDFYSGEVAFVIQEDCIRCGKCKDVCRFDAIPIINNQYVVDPLNCEGCGYCARVCPTRAIENRLSIGADNSGKLVAKVKNEAKSLAQKEEKDYVIVDGSPGVGCPVVSSLSGAAFVVLVTEPTVSGLHDLKRVFELVHKFNIKAGCIINKSDINTGVTAEIESFLRKENIVHLCNLPYDESFTKAMTNGQTIVEYDNNHLAEIISDTWEKVKEIVQ